MAARRLALKAVDWVAFGERVAPNQKSMFNACKIRSDAISAKLASLPETPVAIDWAYYRSAVANVGLVDEFEKKFKALKVPEPVDNMNAAIDKQEVEADTSAKAYIEESKARVVEYQKKLDVLINMPPFDQITIEEVFEAFPETRLDKEKYPYWPHRPISEL